MDEEYEFPMPGMNDAVKFGKDFLAGATAAVVAKTVVAPVERIKLILQLQSAQTTIKAEKRYKGVVDCFVRVPREQGFFSFWRGNLVNIYRSCGQESLGFAFKDFFKIWCLDGVNHNHNYWHFLAGNLAAGGASGAATYCFVYPLDFVRTRLAIDMGRGESREFNGIFDCVRKIVRHDGVFGLYRGFFPSLQYIFLYRGAYYGLFDGTKVLITRSGSDHIGFGYAFLLGQVVTFVAGMISYPLDTVRRRQMMQAGKKEILYRGSWDCTKKIFLNEGPRAFFNGAMVNAIRGTGAALVLAMYNEFAKPQLCVSPVFPLICLYCAIAEWSKPSVEFPNLDAVLDVEVLLSVYPLPYTSPLTQPDLQDNRTTFAMIRTGEAQFVTSSTPTAAVSMPVLPDVSHLTKFGKDFLAGATAAAVAKTVMAPTERVKIILQLQSVQSTITAEKRYNGILDCFVRVPREQGILSFWRGNGVNIVRACSQESLSFAFKDLFKIWFLHGVDHKEQYSRFLAGNVVGGGLSGVVTYCIIYPLDFIRTRLAIDMGKGASREFSGFVDCSRKIVKTDGIVGLYRGFSPSLQYIFIFRSVYFGLFDSGKVLLAKDGEHIGLGKAFCLAQAVSFSAGMTSYPLDTVRRRLMMQAGKKDVLYRGTLDCAMKIWRNEGGRAFFNGALMNAIRGFGGALILSVYTQLARYM